MALGLSYLVMRSSDWPIIDRVGRRRLTLIMVPGAALSLFVLGLLFVTGNAGRDYDRRSSWPVWWCSCSSTRAGCS